MVGLRGVSKAYHGHSKVLDQVHLKLPKGEFLYVIGGSGAGKSTLLRLMATEESASLGAVNLFGYDISAVSPSTLRSIRRNIGYVPQDVRLIPDLTVYENIAMAAELSGKRRSRNDIRARIGELLAEMNLQHRRDVLASTLSGGEAQRVAVARALAREPDLIIADEPTGAQDRQHTWALMNLFSKANARGSTVVIATHDPEIVRRVRKRCAVLKGGHLSLEDGLCIY